MTALHFCSWTSVIGFSGTKILDLSYSYGFLLLLFFVLVLSYEAPCCRCQLLWFFVSELSVLHFFTYHFSVTMFTWIVV